MVLQLSKMDFMNSVRPYLNVFYILGLSPYLTDKVITNKEKSCSTVFFVIIQAAVGLTLCLSCIEEANFGGYSMWSRTDIVIINFVAICEIVRIIFILIQCLFYKDLLSEICFTFRMLQNYYTLHLYHQMPYDKFTREYFRKFVIIICGFMPYFMIFLYESLTYGLVPIGIQIKALQIMTSATYLHIIFYVDILNFYLSELNIVIRRDTIVEQEKNGITIISRKTLNNTLIQEKLRCYKTVHFHLWEVTQRINAFFGWSMVAILLHGFVDFVYTSYWLIQQLQPPWTIGKIIRKFNILITFLSHYRIAIFLEPLWNFVHVSVNLICLVNSSYCLLEKVMNESHIFYMLFIFAFSL